ncbi:MAG: hypothetical protein CMI50_16665 [Paracoccus sp.]|uniref:hypothetical protein n=1 Tax=unclassified Microbacterium TaxID=2609290 RepID=UPI000C3625A6|nr:MULTISPECIES: hypothetical protein [unclassified Microbacterium]MAN58072.1 hypothetical protein [Paracoccus sp. (in: a-proteobacteria)]MAY50920.1 hypothetical protein [Microbacterium sp.]HAS31780.1 hypothetical protein [Microbacterium sp.]HBR89239.1 hypothetical protein [Microbacterium sp.]|tara:strand:+ start:25818 stop:26099 length:282 start_codon:yes stop_codon:yes gene_type:complete
MHTAALILTIVAGAAQLIGVILLITRAHGARALLNQSAHTRLDGGDAAGNSHSIDISDVLAFLLRDAASTWWAVALILLGILAMTAAGILALL